MTATEINTRRKEWIARHKEVAAISDLIQKAVLNPVINRVQDIIKNEHNL